MVTVKVFLFTFVILFTNIAHSKQERALKVLLTVYYESLCPDSRTFIENQLMPTMQQLHEYVKLRLVPFGKARSIEEGFGGFACQHGPRECIGNMVQDCTLHAMKKYSDVDKVAYVMCEMSTQAGTRLDYQCAEQSNVDKDIVGDCISYGKGTFLQLDSEYRTLLVKPTFVPTITINEYFDQDLQNSALDNLLGTMCSVMSEVPPCANMYNSAALQYILS